MAVMESLTMKQASGLANQTNPSALSFYSVSERQIIGSREIAGVYQSDPVRIEHLIHCFVLRSRHDSNSAPGPDV
jgi:hypothetical protein